MQLQAATSLCLNYSYKMAVISVCDRAKTNVALPYLLAVSMSCSSASSHDACSINKDADKQGRKHFRLIKRQSRIECEHWAEENKEQGCNGHGFYSDL